MWMAAVCTTVPPSTSASFVVPPPMSMLRIGMPPSCEAFAAPDP